MEEVGGWWVDKMKEMENDEIEVEGRGGMKEEEGRTREETGMKRRCRLRTSG